MSDESDDLPVMHSNDDGRTWHLCRASKRSVVSLMAAKEIYFDGVGNEYRWPTEDELA